MSIREHLRLYVAGQSRASKLTVSSVRQLCRDQLKDRHCLDIIDVEQRPQLSRLDRIIVVPTLVRWFPKPTIKITGDLSEAERLLKSLVEDPEPSASGRQMHSVLKHLLLDGMHKTAADMATVQLLQKGTGFLRIDAHVGFQRKFLDHFRYVSQEQSAYGAALVNRRRVVVEDVTLSPIFFGPDALAVMLDAGVRALHCAPLRSRLGDMLGVVTMYYLKPMIPLDRDKHALTELARTISRYLEDLTGSTRKTLPIEISFTQTKNDDEMRYAAFLRDSSEKERLQDQLIENERLAAIGITSAKFAHEIANPLNGMAMTAQLLERRLATQGSLSDEKVSSALQSMNKEIKRLNNLLNDFRSLYRREIYNLKPTSLATVIQEVLRLESPEYAVGGIQVEQYCPEDLPLVMADKEKLEQALLNLCRNAAEAMPNGGKLILRGLSSGDQVILEVEDTGIGISDRIDVLQPFTTTKPSGTGLGLVIVRQILAAHNGTMSYASKLDKGTVFTVTLPAA